MLTRRVIENWIIWIVAGDRIYGAYVMLTRGFAVFAAQYAVFTVLALLGLLEGTALASGLERISRSGLSFTDASAPMSAC